MHEVGIMETLLQTALAAAEREGAKQIQQITVRVGPLSGVLAEPLRFAFEALSPNHAALAGAALVIEPTPIRCHCAACDRISDVDVAHYNCPVCGDRHTTLISGRELELTRLEVT